MSRMPVYIFYFTNLFVCVLTAPPSSSSSHGRMSVQTQDSLSLAPASDQNIHGSSAAPDDENEGVSNLRDEHNDSDDDDDLSDDHGNDDEKNNTCDQKSAGNESEDSNESSSDEIPLAEVMNRRGGGVSNDDVTNATPIRGVCDSDSGSDCEIDEDADDAHIGRPGEAVEDDYHFVENANPKHTTPSAYKRPPQPCPAERLSDSTASSCMLKVFPYDLWVHIAAETNVHGTYLAQGDRKKRKKHASWNPVTVKELQTFHALLIGMTIHRFRNRDSYWKKGAVGCVRYPDFGRFMTK
jgi:hypothetical protein